MPTRRLTSTRACATAAQNLRFERALLETFCERADAVVFLQTIEHLSDPGAALEHMGSLVGDRGVVFVSTPNVLTLAPAGAARSDNPWHVHEYRAEEFARLCRSHFPRVRDARAVPRAQTARARARPAAGLGCACTRACA